MTDQQVIIAPEPFTPRVERMIVPGAGQPMKVILALAIDQGKLDVRDIKRVRLYIDGVLLPDDTPDDRLAAMRFIPEAGQIINVAVEPLGNGGKEGQTEQKILQTILTIAVIIMSVTLGPWAAAALAIGGNLAIGAAYAPTKDKSGPAAKRQLLRDTQNSYRPRDPMPLVLGLQRVEFDLAAPPYTQLEGDDAWLHIALAAHYGHCAIDNIKIGQTLLSDYPAGDVQIETFLDPGPARRSYLYPDRVSQENFDDTLDMGGDFEVHTTDDDCERFEIDVTLAGGLQLTSDKGNKYPLTVRFTIDYSVAGTNVWTSVGPVDLTEKTKDPVRRTYGYNVPKGKYDVRVKAADPGAHDVEDWNVLNDTTWVALRTIERRDPIVDTTLGVVFMRIKATDDLNGNLPVVTGEVEPIIPIWNGADWNTEARSSNGAALIRWLLTGAPAAKPMEPAEFHSSCAATYDLIEANNWKGGLLVKDERSQQDVMVGLGHMGRFSTYWNGSKLCFVPDWVREAPRQVFASRNAGAYRYRRSFPEPIHAVFVEFGNLDQDNQGDELWVYADGYNRDNATLFETLRIEFSCTAERAFQEGRVYLAKRLLQVEIHEWTAGIDAIASTYGDRVLVRHPAALYGLGDGRVLYRRWAGGLVAGVRLDEDVIMEAGKTYGIDLRRGEDVIRGIAVQVVPGRTRDLTFSVPLAVDVAPRKGDLIVFGETGMISEDVEIVDVEPQADMTVTFRGIPYIASSIQEAINNPIPPLTTNVKPLLPAPRPIAIAPESAFPDGVTIAVSVGPWKGNPIAGFTGRWRLMVTDQAGILSVGGWTPMEPTPLSSGAVRTGPIVGVAHDPGGLASVKVDVEIRTVLVDGMTSAVRLVEGIEIVSPVMPPQHLTATPGVRIANDGSSYPVIAIAADDLDAGNIQDLQIEIRLHDVGDYKAAVGSPLPARNPAGDLTGVGGGSTYDLRGRWRTTDNWPSAWVYVTNVLVPAGSLVANDTINLGGTPAAEIVEALTTLGEEADAAFTSLHDAIANERINAASLARQAFAGFDEDNFRQIQDFVDGKTMGTLIEEESFERTTETTSLAQKLSLVGAATPDGLAFILDGTTAWVSPTETLAQRFTSLSASDATNAANIINEQTARISDIGVVTGLYTSLSSTVSGNYSTLNAAITTEAGTRATDDLAIAATVTTLTSTVSNNLTTVNASITAEALTRSTADTAIAGTVTTLTSTVNTNNTTVTGLITSEATTRANGDTALAGTISTLTTTVNTNLTTVNSAISSEATTRASADTAIAGTVTTLTSTVSTNYSTLNSAITSEAGTRSTETTALAGRSTTLEAQMANTSSSGLQSRIITEEGVRASADTTIASSVTTLSSTVGGHTATLSTYGTTIADITGRLSASWGVTLDVNNRVSGIQLMTVSGAGTTLSFFDVTANVFRVFDGTSAIPMFEVTVAGAFVAGSRVRTESVAIDALVKAYVASLASNMNWPTTAGATQTVFNVTGVVKDIAASDLRVQVAILNRAGSAFEQQFSLYYTPSGGTKTLVNTRPQESRVPGSYTGIGTTARGVVNFLWIVPGLAAGTYTITLECLHSEGWTAGSGYFEIGSLLEVREAKRAA
jgi:hypothetical protein